MSARIEKETRLGMAESAALERAHALAIREKVRKCLAEGLRPGEIQERLGVSHSIIKEVRAKTGRSESPPRPDAGRQR
jgi:transposase